MTHTENNTKIAEFLGYEINFGHDGKGIIRNGEHISINKLKFHSDFNWLMEAIRTIEQLPNAYDTEEFLLIRDELCTGRVETVYSEVLNFVEWYKEDLPKETKVKCPKCNGYDVEYKAWYHPNENSITDDCIYDIGDMFCNNCNLNTDLEFPKIGNK